MYININITFTFMHISRLILVSKSTSFTFFIWIFTYIITFFHRRFVYIHTFFHYKIMFGCRIRTCLYDIRQTSYECRLHYSRVAPSEPIWAGFAFTIGKICPWSIRTVTSYLSLPVVLRRATIIYMHIFAGENSDAVTCTRTHEKNSARFFFVPIHYMYCILLGKM